MKNSSSLKRNLRDLLGFGLGMVMAYSAWTLYNCPFGCARRVRQMAVCQNNLKSLSLALLRYAEAHNNRLPPAESWMDAIKPYVRNPQVFRCSHTPAHLKYSYGFNANLSNASDSDIMDHSKTILLYEAVSGLPNAHGDPSRLWVIAWDKGSGHGQSILEANFAYADGHTKAHQSLSDKNRWDRPPH